MGANLYINSLTMELSGEPTYFRDNYNYTSVFWAMGLSWWATVIPMLDKNDHLPVAKCKELLRIIKTSEIDLDGNYSESKRRQAERLECFHKDYMENKRAELIQFLERSIEIKIMIECHL